MDANLVKKICICGNPASPSPSLHACNCPVWGTYHKLISAPPK